MSPTTVGGQYDAGLDSIYVMEGDWTGGVIWQFELCAECGRWDAVVSVLPSTVEGREVSVMYEGFPDGCRCIEHDYWEIALVEAGLAGE